MSSERPKRPPGWPRSWAHRVWYNRGDATTEAQLLRFYHAIPHTKAMCKALGVGDLSAIKADAALRRLQATDLIRYNRPFWEKTCTGPGTWDHEGEREDPAYE